MNRIIQGLEKRIEATGRMLGLIGASFLPILTLLIVADVIGRYFFNAPITGAVEISELVLLIVIFLAAAYTMSVGGHVAVEVVTSHFSPRVQALIASFTLIISLAVFGAMVFAGIEFGTKVWRSARTTMILGLPIFPFVFIMPLGILALWLQLLVRLFRSLRQVRKRNGLS